MALQGPDGETHSHLNNEDRQDGYSKHLAQQPDRGTWVGPRPGETHEQHAERAKRRAPLAAHTPAAQEWGDRVDRDFRERLERRLGMVDAPYSTLPPRPTYNRETLEQRVDRLEKDLIKLEKALGKAQAAITDWLFR